MKTNVLFQRVPSWTYVFLLGVLCHGSTANGFPPGGGGAPAFWSINQPLPAPSAHQTTATQLAGSGDATSAGVPLTVTLKERNVSMPKTFGSANSTSFVNTTTSPNTYIWTATIINLNVTPGTHDYILAPNGVTPITIQVLYQ